MKTLVLLSGGLDSTVLLYFVRTYSSEVRAISFDYGQRHAIELTHAKKIAANAGVKHTIVQMQGIKEVLNRGVLTAGGEVPEGHYAEESMKQTVVPNRNMIMLSIAAGHALANGIDCVKFAAHAGDHAIYPDCRPEFADALNAAIRQADWSRTVIAAPFIRFSKGEIVTTGARLNVPFADTWSCYKGGAIHCGKCGTCVERKEAFATALIADPTEYE